MACPPVSEGAALPRQTGPPSPAMQAPSQLRFSRVSLSWVPQDPHSLTKPLACRLAMASAGPAPATGLCWEDGASCALCHDAVARHWHMSLRSHDRTMWGPRSRPRASALTHTLCPLPPQTGWHLQIPAQEGHRFCQGCGQHHHREYCPFSAFA